ncbi:cation diffusion facilitator family transporter [Lewinella sp. IMCC34183]|uniref:cation diffusion facilitator family transporter n=1 Tax=Lewinella sp. IMCC34183 TaxID=2248762 RepID=UPI000E21C590|nr:cation diffusion facilitator family transporter [Lewinella sp. IMCC34183]
MRNEDVAIRTIYFSIGGNFMLAIIKGVAGVLGNSFALVADAIESTADIFSSIMVWMGLRYARRPADENHPYGHGKIEPLITFGVVAFLVFSATAIAYESLSNIRTPHAVPASWTLYVLGGIILWKELSFRFVMRRSRATDSSSLAADAWHHRSDAITSVTAFAGITVALIGGPDYASADDWSALAASGIILYNAWLIFRPALGEIMDEHVYDELIEEIRALAQNVPGILGTEKCYVRKSGMRYHIDLHALVRGDLTVTEGHDLAHRLKDYLKERLPNLGQVLIHVEPFGHH